MSENKELIAIKNFNNYSIEEILSRQNSVLPQSDIYENPEEYTLVANLPGVSRNDIQVKVVDDSLIVFGKINYDEIINRDYIMNENEIGNYFRKFRISDAIDISKISAKYDNGQLIVHLPKKESIKPRTIDIS
jgi:HSP20 family molecular chaperone IbpA